MSEPTAKSKKEIRQAKKRAGKARVEAPQDGTDGDHPECQSSAASAQPATPAVTQNNHPTISEHPGQEHQGSNTVSTALSGGLQGLSISNGDQDVEEDIKPVEKWQQDSYEVTGQFLLANYFSIGAGKYRTLFKYILGFQRRETEADRKTRREERPNDEDFVQVGSNTYIEAHPARAKEKKNYAPAVGGSFRNEFQNTNCY